MRKVKFKTLNNWVSKSVVNSLSSSDVLSAFYLLYNCHQYLETKVFVKTFQFVVAWFNNDLDVVERFVSQKCPPDVRCFIISTIDKLYYEED